MLQTGTDITTIEAPLRARPIDHPNARFLQLRRLMLMVKSASLSAAASASTAVADRGRIEANAYLMRLDALAEEIWTSPVQRWQDVLERAELVAFNRPQNGTHCPWYDQATDALVCSVFVMGGRHG